MPYEKEAISGHVKFNEDDKIAVPDGLPQQLDRLHEVPMEHIAGRQVWLIIFWSTFSKALIYLIDFSGAALNKLNKNIMYHAKDCQVIYYNCFTVIIHWEWHDVIY